MITKKKTKTVISNVVGMFILAVVMVSCGDGAAIMPTAVTTIPVAETILSLDNKDFIITVQDSKILPIQLTQAFREAGTVMEKSLNSKFSLPDRDINILFGDGDAFPLCATPNAFYSNATSRIVMCYSMFNDLIGKYSAEESVAAFYFIFLHEVGHALVKHYKIPVLGKGEDVADTIATVLFIAGEVTQEGKIFAARGVLAAADYFSRGKSNSLTDVSDSHTYGPQRGQDLVCLAWGGVPEIEDFPGVDSKIQGLKNAGRNCQDEFTTKKTNVITLIGKYLKL